MRFFRLGALLFLASVANAACYQFSGPLATLQMSVDTVNLALGPSFVAGGHTTTYNFSGSNTLIVGGSTQTSQSFLDGSMNIQYIPGTPGSDASTFQMVVPSGLTGSGSHSWVAMLASNGDLIPDGLIPTPASLAPVSKWFLQGANNIPGTNYNYIEVQNGALRTKYLITGVSACTPTGPGTNTPVITAVISAGAYGAFNAIAPGSWIEIYGSFLSPDTNEWSGADFTNFTAPTTLDGVEVTINGQKAFVRYVSPGQVNVQVPAGISTGGTVNVVVTNNGVSTQPFGITANATQPGLLAPASFKLSGNQYVGALFADNTTYVLPTNAISGVPSRPAKPGETIILYGIGFGTVNPSTAPGKIAAGATQLDLPLQILFGQNSAQITYQGLAPGYVGLYQFNVVVPSIPDNNLVPLTFTLGGQAGTQTLYIPVHQ